MLSDDSEELKLALRTFVMRNADRDLKADQLRIARVVAAIDGAIREIAVERKGLVARVAQTIDQPEDVSRKILSHRGTPATIPLNEFRLAELRIDQLTRRAQQLEAAKALLLEPVEMSPVRR